MSEPLTRVERDDAQRFWHVRNYGFHYDIARRYEATVKSLEAERDKYRAALEKITSLEPPVARHAREIAREALK